MRRLKVFRLLALGISCVSILSLASCTSKREKIANLIETTLNERYGETFIIDSMGGRNFVDKELKAWVYADGDEENMFKVTVSEDLKSVKDEYKVMLVEREINSIVKSLAEPIFGDVFIDSPVWGKPCTENKSYQDLSEYFKDTEYSGMGLSIYVNTDKEINKDLEANKIVEFLASYKDLNYLTQYIDVYYVKSNVFDRIDLDFKGIENTYKYYGSEDNSYSLFKTPLSDNPSDRLNICEYLNVDVVMDNFRF